MNEEVADIIKAIEDETGCEVISHKEKRTEWSNGAMGLPTEGENYIDMITPGYIMNVKIRCPGGKEYNKVYHSNLEGSILKEKS